MTVSLYNTPINIMCFELCQSNVILCVVTSSELFFRTNKIWKGKNTTQIRLNPYQLSSEILTPARIHFDQIL